MSQVSKHLMNPKISAKTYNIFIDSIKRIRSREEVVNFLEDLLSPSEIIMLSKRVAIAYMLIENKYSYLEISKTLKISYGTIAKIHASLTMRRGGINKIVGDLVLNKQIRNSLDEFMELFLPVRRTITGEKFEKHLLDRKKLREEPL